MILSDEHLTHFEEQGYVVVEEFYPEELRAQISEAIRESHPPWEFYKDKPKDEKPYFQVSKDFPYEHDIFNKLTVCPDLIDFAQRILGTKDIHLRYAHNWAKYPLNEERKSKVHVDNGNCSQLPRGGQEFGQMHTWYFPDGVTEDEAPMFVVPKPYGRDVSKKISLVVPPGTMGIFSAHFWNSATDFKGTEGQRYSVSRLYGRADHYWEGLGSYVNLGNNDRYRKFIGTLTAKEREIFKFPPAGHPYYTLETLAMLEEQYPGWNAGDEYAPGETIVATDDLYIAGLPNDE